MTTSVVDRSPVFDLRVDVFVAASTNTAYSVVSDLPRSSEWSPECRGGTWISGEPSTLGAVFRGENLRSPDVVGWAPLIRGTWHTEARIVAADPGRSFHWMMLSHAGDDQTSTWGFDIEPAEGGCVLSHHHRMDVATAGIHSIVADLDEAQRERFLTEWNAKIADDIAATLDRLKKIIENETDTETA